MIKRVQILSRFTRNLKINMSTLQCVHFIAIIIFVFVVLRNDFVIFSRNHVVRWFPPRCERIRVHVLYACGFCAIVRTHMLRVPMLNAYNIPSIYRGCGRKPFRTYLNVRVNAVIVKTVLYPRTASSSLRHDDVFPMTT